MACNRLLVFHKQLQLVVGLCGLLRLARNMVEFMHSLQCQGLCRIYVHTSYCAGAATLFVGNTISDVRFSELISFIAAISKRS